MKADNTKIIEQYLSGKMSETDHQAFEDAIKGNASLKAEVELQKAVQEAAKRSFIRLETQAVAKSYHVLRFLKWGGLSLGILATILFSIFLYQAKREKSNSKENSVSEYMQKFSKLGPIDNLPPETFSWKGSDTVFLSKAGILVSIPRNAFLLNDEPYTGKVIVQWQEAFDAETILKSGLSTLSDSKLLETQGMFSFTAKTPEGDLLKINPQVGIYLQVPVNEFLANMQLFEGEKHLNGIINWINPRPLEKIPVPIDMAYLDFFPPEYEPILDELKVSKNKSFRDSLYLSFENEDLIIAGLQIDSTFDKESKTPFYVLPERKITSEEMLQIYGRIVTINHNMNFSEAFILKHKNQNVPKELKDFPALFFLNNKIGRQYLFDHAQDSPVLNDYLKYNDFELDKWNTQIGGISANSEQSKTTSIRIAPSTVLGFWNSKFNKTLLATREFENRMKEIHRTCDPSVLELYTQNLLKPMCEIDKMVVAKGYAKFKSFASEQVGSLKIEDPHLEALIKFYADAILQFKEQNRTNLNNEIQKRKKWDAQIKSEREAEIERTVRRNEQAYSEEFERNHKSLLKQFGKTVGVRIYKNQMAYNLDRFVKQTTLDRSTGTFYDKKSGEIGTLKYNQLTFSVKDYGSYQQLYAYLFPNKLNSYHRIIGKNGVFEFALNQNLKYTVVIVGINENGFSFIERSQLSNGNLGELVLEEISEKSFDKRIRSLNARRGIRAFDIREETKWLKIEQLNYREQKRRKDDQSFRNRIRPKVFPCGCFQEMSNTIKTKD